MKQLIKYFTIFTCFLMLYPVSVSAIAAESYKIDMIWVEDNFKNKDFMSSPECTNNAGMLTKFGEKFFKTTGLFTDDINWDDMESFMPFTTFTTENRMQDYMTPLEIKIYSDAIVIQDLDLVFYINDKSIVTRVEHKKKDVSKSFTFIKDGSPLGHSGNDRYFNFDWGHQNNPLDCWFKLKKA